ncbi:MAG: DUF1919 domain-containing protein [Candidatus Ventricola sp.]
MTLIRKVLDKTQTEISAVYNSCFERTARKRLNNDGFSIICSNCIGGLIYHRLGKPFLSPTINLWMSQPDFLKFVLDLRGYLDEELVFIEDKYDYPVALLRDIKIYFAHYHSESEAQDCWNRRRSRVNYDNLYIIMYDRDGITQEDIRQLENIQCKAKIVLSDKKHEQLDYVLTMKPTDNPHGQQFMDRNWLGMMTFEKQFDFVKWLNTGSER